MKSVRKTSHNTKKKGLFACINSTDSDKHILVLSSSANQTEVKIMYNEKKKNIYAQGTGKSGGMCHPHLSQFLSNNRLFSLSPSSGLSIPGFDVAGVKLAALWDLEDGTGVSFGERCPFRTASVT